MDHEGLVRLCAEAMLMCLYVSLPAVVVAALVGFLVAFAQAITSLQEQAIGQAAKFIAVTITIIVAAPWGGSIVLRHAQSLLNIAMGQAVSGPV
jgi:type III secretion protein S